MKNPFLTNPIVAIIFGLILCSFISSMSVAVCPGSSQAICGSVAGIINCLICIYVIYILAVGSKKSD